MSWRLLFRKRRMTVQPAMLRLQDESVHETMRKSPPIGPLATCTVDSSVKSVFGLHAVSRLYHVPSPTHPPRTKDSGQTGGRFKDVVVGSVSLSWTRPLNLRLSIQTICKSLSSADHGVQSESENNPYAGPKGCACTVWPSTGHTLLLAQSFGNGRQGSGDSESHGDFT
nr:hypothetical protein CFP56_64592 [Quercus suber]